MKIAIHNEFIGGLVSESEQAQRIILAAKSLGWEAVERHTRAEIEQYSPDIVLALHFLSPKLSSYPTFGCMWNPPKFFEHELRIMRNVFSYDAYLSGSPEITTWIKDAHLISGRDCFIAPFYPSCHHIPYQAPDLDNPRLLYAGVHWDGPRYRELFEQLDSYGFLDVFGKEEAWSYLRQSYRRQLPFDGVSVVRALQKSGVGLCLHNKEHIDAGVPSARIFEIAASGAIAICQDHSFIREAFGDSVLYISCDAAASDWCDEINAHMDWIGAHQDQALSMSQRSHAIIATSFMDSRLEILCVRHCQ